jgi:hypothetical protein
MVEFYDPSHQSKDGEVTTWVTIEECPDCGKTLSKNESQIFVDSMSDIDRDNVIKHTPGEIVSKYYPLCVDCA